MTSLPKSSPAGRPCPRERSGAGSGARRTGEPVVQIEKRRSPKPKVAGSSPVAPVPHHQAESLQTAAESVGWRLGRKPHRASHGVKLLSRTLSRGTFIMYFDALHIDGRDLIRESCVQRRRALEQLRLKQGHWLTTPPLQGDAGAGFTASRSTAAGKASSPSASTRRSVPQLATGRGSRRSTRTHATSKSTAPNGRIGSAASRESPASHTTGSRALVSSDVWRRIPERYCLLAAFARLAWH